MSTGTVVVSSTYYMHFLSSHTLMSEQYISLGIQIAFQLAGVLNKQQHFLGTTPYTCKMQTAETGNRYKMQAENKMQIGDWVFRPG